MDQYRTETRDGMRIEWDVPIEMDDGTVLRADAFRPVDDGQYPVIMTQGPYAKGLAFQEGFPGLWNTLTTNHPDVLAGSSNKYQNWEVADPEKWVPDGYVCVRVDSRGAGRSPGRLDIMSPRETLDYYHCIEWAGTQPLPEPGQTSFEALGEELTFTTEPFTEPLEITGPAAARLFVSTTTSDADLFLVLRVLDPDGEDVRFVSGLDPAGVVGMGWLRASHRTTDPGMSLPYRPWHTHDRKEPLTPARTVGLDVEIWPTSVVVPSGYRFCVTILGRDFEFAGDGPWPTFYGVDMKGNGVFLHNDPEDRPADVFGGMTTLVSGGDQQSYLLLPVIPREG